MKFLSIILSVTSLAVAAGTTITTTTKKPTTSLTAKPTSTVTAKPTGTVTAKPSSTTTVCPKYETNIVNFDALPTGKAVPSNLQNNFDFTGFTVQNGTYAGVKPYSGKNVALTPALSASVSQTYRPDNQPFFMLKSFAFACVDSYPLHTLFPQSCSIKFIVSGVSDGFRYKEFGPYTYSPDYSVLDPSKPAGGQIPMQNVTFPDDGLVGAGAITFITTDGPGYTQLAFDSFKFYHFNNSCTN